MYYSHSRTAYLFYFCLLPAYSHVLAEVALLVFFLDINLVHSINFFFEMEILVLVMKNVPK